MTINHIQNGSELTIALEGRLDTTTAPSLEADLEASLNGVTALTFDFEKLEYISSAGLRVLLAAQKLMSKQGSMKVVLENLNRRLSEKSPRGVEPLWSVTLWWISRPPRMQG